MASSHSRKLITAVFVVALAGCAQALPRGVDPASVASFAGTGGTFTCLDGSKTIPFSQVNDNYCDCPSDGSDEPGTSACYHGKFYCANRGHQPQHLSASFVDDGICDCCDGSDEKTACTNTCLEKGAAERQVVRDKATEMQQSLEKKKQLISDGTERQASWPARAASIPLELKAQEEEIARLEGEKTTMQAAADEDRKRLQAEEEERRKQNAEREAAEAAAAAEAGAAEQPAGTADGGEAKADAPQETDEERGRRIASQWTNDPDAASAPAEEPEMTEEGGEEGEDDAHHHDEEYDSGGYNQHSTPPHVYSPLDSEVYSINAKLEAARKRLEELKTEHTLIGQHHSSGVKFDYGPGNQFISLAGRCIAETGTRWMYEACFYSHAIQQEPHNLNNKVSLGRWTGWANDYTEALFENGDPCAGAPNRSFRVRLVCGQDEQLWGGEEPSTCVYTAWLMTPLACRQSDLEAEFTKLAELERFEAEIRAEIDAAAAAKASNAHTEL